MTLEDLLHRLVREFVQQELRGLTIAGVPGSPANDLGHTRDSPMTTAQAARYCGFKTTAAIRKALLEGRLVPLGRRGGTGTYMWSRQALDAFLAGARDAIVPCGRPGAPPDEHWRTSWKKTKWIMRWRYAIAPKPVETGGLATERRGLSSSRSGHDRPNGKAATDHEDGARWDASGAYRFLQEEVEKVRGGEVRARDGEDPLRRIRRVAFRKKGDEGENPVGEDAGEVGVGAPAPPASRVR